uniref:Uncharacterized protein n=1 Tax=Megaselia scalaris TaxID=36166 RepID=T1GFH4_MEGSC
MNDSFQQPGQWHNLILTPEHRPTNEPKTHIMSYMLKNLHPGGYYEAIVQAKNRYGWNEEKKTNNVNDNKCILNYSCVADNSLGRSRKYMELSGRPGSAEFYSPKWGRSAERYNLTWKIDSYPPLEEVRLLYRRVL